MRIDLRSDTVTVPTPAMREAMAAAEVGDDVFGDDPTVNRLEVLAAEMAGKEAAVFVTSGTMGNLASLLAHCSRGREVILGDESHIFHYENGSASAFGGLVFHTVATNADGTLPIDALRAAIRLPAHDYHYFHYARPGVICLENTHNRCGGRVLTPEYFEQVAALAREHGLPVHLVRREAVQRRGGCGQANHGLDAARVVRAVVPLQGPLGPGRIAHLRRRRLRPRGAPHEEDAWRRHEAGGSHCRAGHRRADGHGGAAGRQSPQRAHPRRRRGDASGRLARPAGGGHEHRDLPRARHRRGGGVSAALEREGVLISDFGGGRLRLVTHDGITEADCRTAVDVMQRAWAALEREPSRH